MVLDIEAIDGVSEAKTLFEHGIKNVNDLCRSNPTPVSKLLQISEEEARKTIQTARNRVKLVSEFTGDRAQLNTLAARTEVKIEDLLDYLLPEKVADMLRA